MSQSSDIESQSSSLSYSSPHPIQDRFDYDNQLIRVCLKATGTLTVGVRRSNTIRYIKQQLFARNGVSERLPVFYYNDRLLEDDQTVSYYGLDNESTIYIEFPFCRKLYVKIPTRRPMDYACRIYARETDTVQAVKSLVLHKERIESDRYDLWCDRRCLRVEQTLAAQNVPSNAVLHLIPIPENSLLIFISIPFQGTNTRMRVRTSTNIGALRRVISGCTPYEYEGSRLYKDATWLRDSRTIGSYNIIENDVIEFKSMISIHVQLWTSDKILTVRAWPTDDAKQVTCKVLEMLRKPFRVHPLRLNDTVLDEGQPIGAYGIRAGSTLVMDEA